MGVARIRGSRKVRCAIFPKIFKNFLFIRSRVKHALPKMGLRGTMPSGGRFFRRAQRELSHEIGMDVGLVENTGFLRSPLGDRVRPVALRECEKGYRE